MKGEKKKSFVSVVISLMLLFVLICGTWSPAFAAGILPSQKGAQAAFVIPTFNITSVDPHNTVTITTYNFPAGDTFTVLMNTIGTRGVGGTAVATVNSGAGGTFTATFTIPAWLHGQGRIAIRLESPTSGYFSYNWFWNTSGGIPVTGPTPAPFVTPTFSIQSVVANSTVTIKTANFPANDTFIVLMNFMGTRGVGGTQVASIDTGAGGTLTMTFNIPASLAGQQQIAIRLESPTSGYFSFNWFWNNTTGDIPVTGPTPTPGPTPTTAPPFVIPTFSITGVVTDTSVTIQTANFPAGDTFTVTMGDYGTRGVGGINAGTFNSGTGGTQTATSNIPAGMAGKSRIAIRLQSPTSGYFSYNWFWNSTYP